jgi:hypothetical protein
MGEQGGLVLREGLSTPGVVQGVADAELGDTLEVRSFLRRTPQIDPVSWQAIAVSMSTVKGVPFTPFFIASPKVDLNQAMSWLLAITPSPARAATRRRRRA